MPLSPYELMFAKIWANGLVVVVAVILSLFLIVKGAIGVPIAGSIPLFLCGLVIYLFSVTALGVMLATLVRSMPQFGLLAFPVFIVMSLLSGGQTLLRACRLHCRGLCSSFPPRISSVFSQAVLFRNATPAMVWPRHDEDVADRRCIYGFHAFQVPQDARGNPIGALGGYALFKKVDSDKVDHYPV